MYKKNCGRSRGSDGRMQARLPQCGIATGLGGRLRNTTLWPRDDRICPWIISASPIAG
jgi:hypothetical protein